FVATTNLDASRGVIWNMGAIAVRGDDAALKLFRDIMLASTAIPGLFPPVLIDVEASGKPNKEMHADGGLSAQLYTAPETMLNSSSSYKLPATELYVVVNTGLSPEFQMTERSLLGVLGRTISVGVRSMMRVGVDRAAIIAKRSGIPFHIAYPALAQTDQQARGVFDSEFMKGLYEIGVTRGRTGTPFVPDVSDALGRRLRPENSAGGPRTRRLAGSRDLAIIQRFPCLSGCEAASCGQPAPHPRLFEP